MYFNFFPLAFLDMDSMVTTLWKKLNFALQR